MSLLKNAEKIEVEGSTVDFYKYYEDETTNYYFDTSDFAAPEPMLNAMAGLQLLKDNLSKLIMINTKPPMGLFPRIQKEFKYDIQDTEEGKYKIIFSLKEGSNNQTDFTNNSCSG
ncbi:MAG: hypothetical protein ACERKK_02860 [Poseidonibacter sp.]|uniref:hypothetical protein n=1 Tax=Poseidonibacter sp. TaxID=2321188 RepID=UPI00359E6AEE